MRDKFSPGGLSPSPDQELPQDRNSLSYRTRQRARSGEPLEAPFTIGLHSFHPDPVGNSAAKTKATRPIRMCRVAKGASPMLARNDKRSVPYSQRG